MFGVLAQGRPKFSRRTPLNGTVDIDNEIGIVMVTINQEKLIHFKIATIDENDKKTLIISNIPVDIWEDDRPVIKTGKDYYSVDYYDNGLFCRLKDANGNIKIPFKISFDKEIYIGEAADEHPEFLMPDLDLEMLLNTKSHPELAKKRPDWFVLDSDNKYKVLLKTANGIKKTSPRNLYGIFLASIYELLEEKLGKPVDLLQSKFLF
uniref:Uncharacterized protein n=1 Tax=Panagrolaimus sp. JU765 TaxID=591449 RepID=A0AC34Q7M1_9BILA